MYSVAGRVAVSRTSTVNVVDADGRWLTVTGTFTVPSSSSTLAVYAAVDDASDAWNAIFAARWSSSSIVTVAIRPDPCRV